MCCRTPLVELSCAMGSGKDTWQRNLTAECIAPPGLDEEQSSREMMMTAPHLYNSKQKKNGTLPNMFANNHPTCRDVSLANMLFIERLSLLPPCL